jgi:NTP pyrophosphatase (non-canonical NTP hydrolase)
VSEPVVPGYEFSDNNINRSDFDVIGFACGLNDYKRAVSECAHEHGWWEDPNLHQPIDRNMGEMIALMHSELSEGLEAHRDGEPFLHYKYPNYAPARYETLPHINGVLGKPCGLASEFADVIIRILDTCHTLQIPITEALINKHRYNLTRPYRHGGKKA